ncbi:hypothetical protein NQ314_010303 [Rhamnusium bicolor]|uniref:Kaptin n=1 Tax=Rhamnusium bicolor TaxID=1586634 RepID=A0AAV8XTS1_9CUCU|nr:hypothetical protein NQ314_010303 [Rhamnusium bicolor]
MEQFRDAHYFYIPSQGNIYTMTDLKLANGSTKLLVASLKREIFCFEYQESPTGSLVPTTKEVSFTYIPNGAEIISLDAFNKSSINNEFVIGITIIKNSNDSDTLETYLNIYSEWEESEDFDIENIAQNCLNVELSFIPYKLLHTFLVTWQDENISSKEIVFILSGSDCQVHIYREHSSDHVYKEMENKDYFPEFIKTPSPVVWIDIYYTDDYTDNVLEFGLSDYATLPRLDSTSILTCCEIADIDFDGQKEILIGNSAEEIMLLKRDKERGWCLEELKKIAAPILSLRYLDISGDGVKELVVLSMKGVHVLQHDFNCLQNVLDSKIQSLTLPNITDLKL